MGETLLCKLASLKPELTTLARDSAVGTLAIRGGLVGANFGVMIWLTLTLGLADFGALIFLWGVALVISTFVSGGGPLILLRRMSGSNGLRIWQIVGLVIVLPALLSIAGWLTAQTLWPDPRWGVVFAAAFSVNVLGCLAGIMRALGSVQISMTLRDAGPFLALGLVVALSPKGDVLDLLWIAVCLMMLMAALAAGWCISRRARLSPAPNNPHDCWSWSLWGASVLGMVLAQIDLIVGGAFMGPEALGLYALLRRIANVVALPVTVDTWISATPIAAAFDSADKAALKRASASGSQIAWYPATVICAACLCGLVLAAMVSALTVTPEIAVCFGILLVGAMVQAFLASGFTVATLSNHAALAVTARAMTVLIYLGIGAIAGAGMTPIGNALGYTFAASLGSGFVWIVLLRNLGVDTSARVLWRSEVPAWKTS